MPRGRFEIFSLRMDLVQNHVTNSAPKLGGEPSVARWGGFPRRIFRWTALEPPRRFAPPLLTQEGSFGQNLIKQMLRSSLLMYVCIGLVSAACLEAAAQ